MTTMINNDSNVQSLKKDVPLKKAIVAWQTTICDAPKVTVFALDDDMPKGFDNHTQAYRPWCRDTTDAQRLNMLFADAWRIVCGDCVRPSDVHEALRVIPEYRSVADWWFIKTWVNGPIID